MVSICQPTRRSKRESSGSSTIFSIRSAATGPGFRLLEIGCGYGHLLRLAKQRGAHAVGVNLSPEQVKYCNDNGLQVYCCNYRDLLEATPVARAIRWCDCERLSRALGAARGRSSRQDEPDLPRVVRHRSQSARPEHFRRSLRDDGHSCETRGQAGVSVDPVVSPTQGLRSPTLQPAPQLDGRLLSG